jgi:hypothetical protein
MEAGRRRRQGDDLPRRRPDPKPCQAQPTPRGVTRGRAPMPGDGLEHQPDGRLCAHPQRGVRRAAERGAAGGPRRRPPNNSSPSGSRRWSRLRPRPRSWKPPATPCRPPSSATPPSTRPPATPAGPPRNSPTSDSPRRQPKAPHPLAHHHTDFHLNSRGQQAGHGAPPGLVSAVLPVKYLTPRLSRVSPSGRLRAGHPLRSAPLYRR